MEMNKLYTDISKRTQGDIYIGVVGPVRTGKSTFIKRFMETLVVPNIAGEFQKQRAVDELPQSAAGRTIMTAEPKFIPDEAVRIELSGGANMRVKMIDCVGYIVPSSLGYIENDAPRMVRTPWFDEPIPFNMAAEMGTKKVITDHSTIGIVITTDATFGELDRSEFLEAEERVISELLQYDKPFVIIVNSAEPKGGLAQDIAQTLSAKYDVPAMAYDCSSLEQEDIQQILESVLFEFPVKEIGVDMPGWVNALDADDPLKKSLTDAILNAPLPGGKIRNIQTFSDAVGENEAIASCRIAGTDLGSGTSSICVELPRETFYEVLSRKAGAEIRDDGALMKTVAELSAQRERYARYAAAIDQAETGGYGVVMPERETLTLAEPEMIRQDGHFGVRLRATAPSMHIIKADIETQVTPVIGTEEQSRDYSDKLLEQFRKDPDSVWQSDIFGRSLFDLVNDGLRNKLYNMPDEARDKYRETLERILNEGGDGLICIIL